MEKEESKNSKADLANTIIKLIVTKDGVNSIKMIKPLNNEAIKQLAGNIDRITGEGFVSMVKDYINSHDKSINKSKGNKFKIQKVSGNGIIHFKGKFDSILSKLDILEQNLGKNL